MKQLNNIHRGDFLDILPKNSIGVELGVFKGEFAIEILNRVQPKLLWLIDPWWLLGKHKDDEPLGRPTDWKNRGDHSIIDDFTNFVQHIKDVLLEKRVKIKIENDLEALPTYEDNYFDWAYIDSSHEYEHTKKELEILQYKVKDGGYILGHDWQPDPNHRHHGVTKAVNEFINETSFELVYLDNRIQWCIQKKSI